MAKYLIHPVDMINLGCKNQFSVGIAYQVYMNLCEVQAMRDVKYLYNKELDLLYLTAFKEGGDNSCTKPEIFLPLSTVSDFTPTWIKKVQDILCSDHEEKGLTLAMKEHDSTVVYYRMTQGLVPPDSPDTARRNKQREEQKRCIEMEVRKMRQELLDKASSVGKSEDDKAECTGDDVGKEKDLTSDGDKTAECKISQENPREPDVSSTEIDNEEAKPT